jgi:hypothetical protein
MWVLIILLALVLTLLYVYVISKREKFTIDWLKQGLADAVRKLTATNPELATTGLTAAIYNAAKKLPKPISPKAGFDAILGREADDMYTPGFYKIQTSFPPLTKYQPRKFNLIG